MYLGFTGSSAGKELTCIVGGLGSIPGFGRSPGGRNSYPRQYPGPENSMHCIVHVVAKSRTRLSDFHFRTCIYILFHFIFNCGLSQDVEYSFLCYRGALLSIYSIYNSLHLLIPNSQPIPSLPCDNHSLLSMPVNLLLFHK